MASPPRKIQSATMSIIDRTPTVGAPMVRTSFWQLLNMAELTSSPVKRGSLPSRLPSSLAAQRMDSAYGLETFSFSGGTAVRSRLRMAYSHTSPCQMQLKTPWLTSMGRSSMIAFAMSYSTP